MTAAYTALDRAGVLYEIVDLPTAPDAVMEYVMELGHLRAPIVVAMDQDHWAGFRPHHIARIAKLQRQPE